MQFRISLKEQELAGYLVSQLNSFFPSKPLVCIKDLLKLQSLALNKLEFCFSKINIKYFCDGKTSIFNHLNGDQYSMYLYLMSFLAYKDLNNSELASKIYLLNKSLHGIDAFYEVELPNIFLFIHPLGTVLGRASYSDYLLVYQRCGIGANKGFKPSLGKFLTLHPGASILGRSVTGNNCAVGSDSLVIDKTIKDNTTYIGNPKNYYLLFKESDFGVWKI